MSNKIAISGYAEDSICSHCGRKLKHGIKLSNGCIVGANCFDKDMTKQRINGKKKYRYGAAHIIHIAQVVEFKPVSKWDLYNVSVNSTIFELVD
ncbi:hypothetical protein D3C86_1735100 [compost metagenome]